MAASSILGSLLESAVAGGTDPVANMSAFMRNLGTYFTQNVTLQGVFSSPEGSGPTLDKCDGSLLASVVVLCKDPGGGDGMAEWTDWMNSVYSAIKTEVKVSNGTTSPIGNPPAFSNLVLGWGRGELLSAFDPSSKSPTGPIYDKMAELIIKDLKTGYSPTYPASFMGTGTVGVMQANCP